jgi:hypothetical protein
LHREPCIHRITVTHREWSPISARPTSPPSRKGTGSGTTNPDDRKAASHAVSLSICLA